HTSLYILSLHDALPICLELIVDSQRCGVRQAGVVPLHGAEVEVANEGVQVIRRPGAQLVANVRVEVADRLVLGEALVLGERQDRSEEHTSELQSPYDLV